jgi:hypothetical protein
MFKLRRYYSQYSERVTRNHISFLLRNAYFYYTKEPLKKLQTEIEYGL